MVVTQTNEQAFELAYRLARGFPQHGFWLFTRKDLPLSPVLEALPNLRIIHEAAQLPHQPCVVIANATKWSWLPADVQPFDVQIIDEAFQLPDYRFYQIAGLAERIVLVGDPGQIAPVVTCQVERWRGDPSGPHIACPHALLVRHPHVPHMSLPFSWRLVPDTVHFVQPAFYPKLPFAALSAPGERHLTLGAIGGTPLDQPMNAVARGASLVLANLPPLNTGEVDPQLAETIVALIKRLFERGAQVWDAGRQQPLTPSMVGVVCAHVSQVNAVRERLGPDFSELLVETADRFQGLQREVIVVYHPLSGRIDASEFHLDAGRLCVMVSRHRVACVLVARGGIEELLSRYVPSGDRALGEAEDTEFTGWHAHISLLRALTRQGRAIDLSRGRTKSAST
jgi:hypothetical protein